MLTPKWYFLFARHLQAYPGNYLETGTYDGDGIRHLANLYPGKMFYAVDPFISDIGTTDHSGVPVGGEMEVIRGHARSNFILENMKLFEEPSREFIKRLDDETCASMNVDCVLIDGAHNYSDACIDLSIAAKLIQFSGLIVCDDVGIDGVGKALEEFQSAHWKEVLVINENTMRYRRQ